MLQVQASLVEPKVAADHQEGSGLGCCDADGNVIPYHYPPPKEGFYGYRELTQDFRKSFIEKRTQELDSILDVVMAGPKQRPFEFDKVLQYCDKKRIIMSGHSFGAGTVSHMLSVNEISKRSFHESWKESKDSPGGFCLGALLLDVWATPLPTGIDMRDDIPIYCCLSEVRRFNI